MTRDYIICGKETPMEIKFFSFIFLVLNITMRNDSDGYERVTEVINSFAERTATFVAFISFEKMVRRETILTLYRRLKVQKV